MEKPNELFFNLTNFIIPYNKDVWSWFLSITAKTHIHAFTKLLPDPIWLLVLSTSHN